MQLTATHDYWLVAASFAVALMAGFTGLSLTQGASELTIEKRKLNIVLAAIALGGGIWSMHFVAMLGLQLPIAFYYDALVTLISALIAILFVGMALLLLHFWQRTNLTIVIAGTLVGAGILAMHYLGMSGMQLCLPRYTPIGVAISVVASIALSITAFWIAYGQRTHRNIVVGTLFFGFAVFTVHFVAIAGTSFIAADGPAAATSLIGNETLAFVVTIGSFVIMGAFLLSGVTFLPTKPAPLSAGVTAVGNAELEAPIAEGSVSNPVARDPSEPPVPGAYRTRQMPFEKNGRTYFIDLEEVAAVRAEGHYTVLYSKREKLFCPWSISEAAKRLPSAMFIRSHRSYLINPNHVSGFERKKDNGICYFDDAASLDKVPVSRSRLSEVRKSLGLA